MRTALAALAAATLGPLAGAGPTPAQTAEVQVQPVPVRFDLAHRAAAVASDASEAREAARSRDVTIEPPARDGGTTLREMEQGFFLGRWTVRRPILLGRSGSRGLEPATYQAWLARPDGVWSLLFADDAGEIRSHTTELTIGIDGATEEPLFPRIRIRTIDPPYGLSNAAGRYLRDGQGRVVAAAGDIITDPLTPDTGDYAETPCQPAYQTRWVKIDNPYSADPTRSTICHGYRECVSCCD